MFTNFELRQYDARLARWMSTDPYYQHHSPYLAMGNNPVSGVDPDGGFVDGFLTKAVTTILQYGSVKNLAPFITQTTTTLTTFGAIATGVVMTASKMLENTTSAGAGSGNPSGTGQAGSGPQQNLSQQELQRAFRESFVKYKEDVRKGNTDLGDPNDTRGAAENLYQSATLEPDPSNEDLVGTYAIPTTVSYGKRVQSGIRYDGQVGQDPVLPPEDPYFHYNGTSTNPFQNHIQFGNGIMIRVQWKVVYAVP